jgi:hypothetical protein
MNILIEDAEKLEYLTSSNQWTKTATDGKVFKSTADALAVAKQQPVGKFNIVAFMSLNNQFINMNKGSGKGVPEVVAV